MGAEQQIPQVTSDQSWAAWKGLDTEDLFPQPAPHKPASRAVVHFSETVIELPDASGANYPNIPFGD